MILCMRLSKIKAMIERKTVGGNAIYKNSANLIDSALSALSLKFGGKKILSLNSQNSCFSNA